MPFDQILAAAPAAFVREIVGAPLIGVLGLLDPSLVDDSHLRRLADEMADPGALLSAAKSRDKVLEVLPVAKARELAAVLGVPVDPLPSIYEIGRASWRERVCQHVQIAVVAGSLKKKERQTN